MSFCGSDLLLRSGLGAFSEAILEPSGHCPKMAHPPCACRLPANGLLTPVIFAKTRCRVSTCRALRLLNVETTSPTSPAQCVRLVPALAEASRTFTHGCYFLARIRERPELIVCRSVLGG
eukprot:TRINITY_DN14_c0_g1_i1.p1 TRINITY_DN14_c0_g1~~TRINITY_DN14_c0_g1_i1.p1  ORF type:complete len:120 (+),score=5.08 TRINITY_DN14_c0_g1_i1:1687-2046(+)